MTDKIINGRVLGRVLAKPLNYSAFFSDPEAARKGKINYTEIGNKTTCTASDDEDDG